MLKNVLLVCEDGGKWKTYLGKINLKTWKN